jgi:hypothetical protein
MRMVAESFACSSWRRGHRRRLGAGARERRGQTGLGQGIDYPSRSFRQPPSESGTGATAFRPPWRQDAADHVRLAEHPAGSAQKPCSARRQGKAGLPDETGHALGCPAVALARLAGQRRHVSASPVDGGAPPRCLWSSFCQTGGQDPASPLFAGAACRYACAREILGFWQTRPALSCG